jgi:hypothetical protein
LIEGNKFECDGKVDEKEVELLETEVGERFFASGTHVLGFVVGVPELAGDPEVIAGAKPGGDGGSDTLADEGFIAVVGGAIEVAVAAFDGLMDNLWSEVLGDFPGAETRRREGGAVGKEMG